MGAILREGGEAGSLDATGWFRPSPSSQHESWQTSPSGATGRQDFNSNGGSWLWGHDSPSGTNEGSHQLERDAREVWVRVAVIRPGLFNNQRPTHVSLDDSTGASQANVRQDDQTSIIQARRGTTVLGSSGPGALPAGLSWKVLLVRIYIDNVSGEIEVFKDYDFTTPLISITGVDTQDGTDNFARFFRQTAEDSVYDDLGVNDATVVFDTTGGTLAPGDTITGNNTGTTAIVTDIVGGTGSAQGVAQVHFVRVNGTDAWNDPTVDPWDTDTQLTNGSGWTANILAPKSTFKDDNSGPIADGYIFAIQPSADVGGKIQLTRAGIDTGANYSQVAAIPADDATALQSAVETATPGDRDIYELEDTSTVGFGVGEINSVQTVTISAVWRRDGAGLNNGNLVVEDSGTEFDGPGYALAVSESGDARVLNAVPDGTVHGTTWSEAKVNSLRAGIKFTG